MPSSSKKQHNFMEAIAHNKAFAKKVGVSQSVGRDFSKADKGKTFNKGGDTMASKMSPKMDPKMMAALMSRKKPMMSQRPMPRAPMPPVGGRMSMDNQMMQSGSPEPGTPGMMKKGGKVKKMAMGGMAKNDMAQDKKMIKKAVGMHDKQQHGGKKTSLTTLKNGGMAMKKMAGGGLSAGHKDANGVAKKGLTKGTMVKMSKGGRYC
jgi:hypothetical protein